MQISRKIYDWLAASDTLEISDVIFVLAGRECRKRSGFKLLEEGWAPALLLSIGRFEIRRFPNFKLPVTLDLLSMAASIEPKRRHFFVSVGAAGVHAELVPTRSLGTWSEIVAFARWLREHPSIRSAIIVSSGFHLKRVRWCCRALIRTRIKLRFVAVTSENPGFNRNDWWQHTFSRKLVLLELVKVFLYPLLRRLVTPTWLLAF